MRIAFFCPTVSGAGGIETATRNLISGFHALGDATHLFLFGGSFDQAWLEGIEHTSISSPREMRAVRLLKYALGAVDAIRTFRPDVIICSDTTTLQIARIGRVLSRKRNVLLASWIHFPVAEIRFKKTLRHADLHLAISEHIETDLKKLLPQGSSRVTTIMNAVQNVRATLVPRPGRAVFLYVGRLTFDDHKRVNDILSAAARLNGEWTLKIAGAAPKGHEDHARRLHALATELGIQHRVEWMGWQKDPWTTAGEVTAIISASAREGFAMVLIEALSHGIVCVGSACSGSVEIIEPEVNGWLFPIGDVVRLAEHMQRLVDRPLELPPQEIVQNTVERFGADTVALKAKHAIEAARHEKR